MGDVRGRQSAEPVKNLPDRMPQPPNQKRCYRCGGVGLRGGHIGPKGEPCRDRGECSACHMVVYVNERGVALSHRRYEATLGRVIKCDGTGTPCE